MKPISTTLLPALALLTLGGCASSSDLATTEPDGVYYSSKDRTTEVYTASASPAATEGTPADDPNTVANPEYQEESGQSARHNSSSDEYYDDEYSYSARIRRFHQPYYRGLGMGYYDYAFVDPFWYNPGAAFYGYDMYGPYGGWGYGPRFGGFYDPFWGGSYLSINIGFGSPWGWGRPYRYGGYGYGRGFYDGYYAGMYGYPRYGVPGYGWDGYRGGTRNVRYGPRGGRSSEALTTGGRSASGGRARVEETGGRSAASNGNLTMPAGSQPTRRTRVAEENVAGGLTPASTMPNGKTRSGRVADNVAGTEAQPASPGRGKLYRILDTETPATGETGGTRTPARVEQPGTERKRVSENVVEAPQPQAAPDYSQPQPRQRRARTFEFGQSPQPAQPSQERPARRERTYEPAPSRSYEPAPSRSGGSFGGGNSGGGSSSGGGRGGRGRVQ
ncbi:hypothetical protein [Hymenobacter sp. B81]|uniref:hypothetical protein n=1 Tax=Hymenobacter sp. B81 TaxID=3344878 RepID=UPI0037DC37EF